MIIVGSRALAIRAPGLMLRKPVDFDFVCQRHELVPWILENTKKLLPPPGKGRQVALGFETSPTGRAKATLEATPNCEFEIVEAGKSSEVLYAFVMSDPETLETPMGLVPNLDLLFTLKASHRFLKNSVHFWKTVADYHLLKRAGAHVRPEYRDFLAQRERETYSYAHPNLNQGKDGFFSGDQITYVYDHDSVHRAVARDLEPAYTLFQRDGAEVAVDRRKFDALPHEIQLDSVIEEACVLAIERSLVPFPGAMTPESAWRYALMKVCTSITSGWWREFAYDNILDVLDRYPADFWERFQRGVSDGSVVRL